jgi:hypothetical protein
MSTLSYAKYSAHPTFLASPKTAVQAVTRQHLRALVWYHASTAGSGRKAADRVVDPRQWKVDQLRAHASSVLHGIIRLVTGPDMGVILAQYIRESADDQHVADVLATAAPASEAPGNRRSRRQRGHDASEGEEDNQGESGEEGGQQGHSAPGVPLEDDGGGVDEGEREDQGEGYDDPHEGDQADGLGDSEDDNEEPVLALPTHPRRRGPGRPRQAVKLVATVPSTGATKATTAPTTSRPKVRIASPTRTVKIMAHCIKCAILHDITSAPPAYCDKCGNQWGIAPTATPPINSAAGTLTTTTAPIAAAPAPTTWLGASQFRPPAVTAIPHRRAPGLAPLDEKIIKHAREGKQHYTLADLLPLRAEDRTTTSSVALSETAIMFDPSAGTFASAVGSAATSVKSAAARRRTITGFTEISEAIHYSLIAIIYVDRPDICWQLYHLLLLALDLTRARGWQYALDYIEAVRVKFYESTGGPNGRHYLLIDSQYDMGVRDMDILFDVNLHSQGNIGREHANRTVPGRTDAGRTDTGRADSGHGKQRQGKGVEYCRGFNSGTCTRKAADCKFQHRCSACGASAHSVQNCTSHGKAAGSTASPAVSSPNPNSAG